MMRSNGWNDFYESGRVSDYLRYIDNVRNSTGYNDEYSKKDDMSNSMESVRYAGKSDGNGAIGHTGW